MAERNSVSLVRDPSDGVAMAPPVSWAVEQLSQALSAKGVTVEQCEQVGSAAGSAHSILIASPSSSVAQGILSAAGTSLPESPEALALVEGSAGGQPALLAAGTDVLG
ncbi:MAG TPA: hypothetical protein VGW38_27650, partial [Chloroflexota bacterium]|nr:hypothetical protein [Chloroflexota bacterium]